MTESSSLSEGLWGLWWGHPLFILMGPWVEKYQALVLGIGCQSQPVAFFPWPPSSPQGDIQELLISPDPQAAFQACERYLPGCDNLDPVATGVSEAFVLRSG